MKVATNNLNNYNWLTLWPRVVQTFGNVPDLFKLLEPTCLDKMGWEQVEQQGNEGGGVEVFDKSRVVKRFQIFAELIINWKVIYTKSNFTSFRMGKTFDNSSGQGEGQVRVLGTEQLTLDSHPFKGSCRWGYPFFENQHVAFCENIHFFCKIRSHCEENGYWPFWYYPSFFGILDTSEERRKTW